MIIVKQCCDICKAEIVGEHYEVLKLTVKE